MEDQLSNILKQQLKDVHLPADVSWWPLAYGWWALIIIGILLLALTIFVFLRGRKRNAYRHAALAALSLSHQRWRQDNDVSSYLQTNNAIVKRTVLHCSKEHEAASLSGDEWLELLRGMAKDELSDELSNALSVQLYQANPKTDIDLIHPELCNWVKTHSSIKASSQQSASPIVGAGKTTPVDIQLKNRGSANA